jgi:bifunctional UDP-N-acetylglucosamine pyrophosphorylase/glucosamine-1-phosphate N-acetyltransferase
MPRARWFPSLLEALTREPTRSDVKAGSCAAIVMAAGRGVRMKSRIPKVLHTVGGIPMVRRVVDALAAAGVDQTVVCIGPGQEAIQGALPPGTRTVIQAEQLGTGDAVRVGLTGVPDSVETILVLGADSPLLTAETLRELLASARAAISVSVCELDDPHGYGRVVFGLDGGVQRIVEEADATEDERKIRLVDGWPFAFNAAWLRGAIGRLQPASNGELYWTQLIGEAVSDGELVWPVRVADPWEILGVNDRRQLADMEAALRRRTCRRLMDAGVTIVDPSSTYIEEQVSIGQDSVVHPQSFLRGETRIGETCVVGPGADITNCHLGNEVEISYSVIEDAQIEDRVHIGPYARVRAGTILREGVYLGSFAEVKNSIVGRATQMHHFSYLGDADVGPGVNIGAGAITANYDGTNKHRTTIGARVSIGSDTIIVAPRVLGDGAMTAAGSVVTHDVPPGGRVAGVPARPMNPKPDDPKGTDQP